MNLIGSLKRHTSVVTHAGDLETIATYKHPQVCVDARKLEQYAQTKIAQELAL